MLSKRISALKPSATLALAARAKQLSAEGKDIISLTVGEPDWDSFESAQIAGVEAIRSGKTKYMPTEGLPELRKLIAQEAKIDTGIEYDISQVTVSAGAKFIIFSALQSLIDPGDEVIIPAPYWVSYPDMVQLCEGISITPVCGKQENFKLSAKNLSACITKKTKAIIINSPSNPTGEVYSQTELKDVARVLMDNPGVYVICDDIYNRLYFEATVAPHLLKAEPKLRDRVLVVSGASKTYAMTGWRVGWALGPKWWIDGMNNYQSQTVSCAASISQIASIGALKSGNQDIANSVKILLSRRDQLYAWLKLVPNLDFKKPEGAFYFWVDVSYFFGKSWNGKVIKGSQDFVKILLENHLVATVDGASFGLEGYIRISYAQKEAKLKLAVDRINKFISEIK